MIRPLGDMAPCRVLLVITAIAGVLLAQVCGADEPPAKPLFGGLRELLAYADRHSPKLAGAAAETAAAEARIGSAGALDDPMLRIEPENILDDGLNLSPAEAGRTRYEIMQDLPWSGKRTLRRDIATADAEQSAAAFRRERSGLRREIRMAYADWLETEGRLRVLDEIAAIMADAEAVARTRYAAGLVPQGDVLRAQLELSSIENDRLELTAGARSAQARLNGLIGRRSDTDLPPPATAELEALPTLDQAEQRLVAHAPEIEAASALERAADTRNALTLRERWPDLRVGVSAMQNGSQIDEWGLMLELNLPLQQARRRADEAESAAMRDAAWALREEAVVRSLAGLRQAHAEASGALARRQLIEHTLAVQAQLTLTAALAAYHTGASDFLGVIDATLQIMRIRTAAIAATASYNRWLAEFLDYLGEA
ncbi:MAG: TolC family protein [Lysobacterales bacterium]|nr:MAG: TolC family protein [Xanthomonadales bacterium]